MTDIHRSQGPQRGPGKRPHRIREYLHLRAIEVKRTEPELSNSEAQRIAQQDLQQLIARGGEDFLRKVEQLAPICVAPKRGSLYRMVELAAITRLPGIRWLSSQLEGYAQSGPYTDYSSAVAVLLAMASGISRPSIRGAREMLRGNALAGFALGHPVAKAESSLYENIQNIYARTPPELTCMVNVDLVRRLAAPLPKCRRSLPTGIGTVGVVDGTDIPGHFQQRRPLDPFMRNLLMGGTAPRAAYVRYVDEKEGAFKRWAGYKLVLISDLASTLPLIWGMFPASVDERRAARSLLDMLFEMWPECPMTYLVGDANFDHAEGFHIELEGDLSIHPVFASHGQRLKGSLSIPKCKHGPMTFRHTDGYPTLHKRVKESLPRGRPMNLRHARRRFVCPVGRCPDETQRFLADPRGHSFLPRHGDSPMTNLRAALLLRRNGVESVNSQLKNLGLGGHGQGKLRTRRESTLDWLIHLGMLTITATRYIHHTDLYERTEQVAHRLDLLRYATPDAPNPGPDASLLKEAEAALDEIFGPPEAPGTAPGQDSEEPKTRPA
jgi:hypothetical protein